MQVVDVKLGSEGDVNVQLVQGVIVLKLDEKTQGLEGGLVINVPLTYFLEALKLKLNNALVSSIIGVLEGVLNTLP